MTKRRGSSTGDQTQPSEIPTALLEDNPFSEEEYTVTEDKTLDATPTSGASTGGDSSDASRWSPDKFRRPTESEILNAVDEVKTEAVDVAELARARAEQLDDEDYEDEEDDEDD